MSVPQWEKYEAGTRYNSSFKENYYENIKIYHNFYDGDQWVGLSGNNNLPHPVFNIIKRIVDFKIASLTSSDIAVNVEPLENNPTREDGELLDNDLINAEIDNIFEKWNFRILKKDALRKGAISGDMCAHILFNPNKKPYRGFAPEVKGEIEIELIDSTNVMFGNANIKDVEKQPYIILMGRDMVDNLKREAKMYKSKDIENISRDSNTYNQSTDFAEYEVPLIEGDSTGKAKYIYLYEKKIEKDGGAKIYVTKCTQDAIIYENIDIGLSEYPIAFTNWYKQDNTYHGRGEVEGVIPNQISINKMVAMIIYHQMMTAFPTAVFDGDVLDDWNNEIGSAIKLENMQGRNIKDVAGYLAPADMSGYIISTLDFVMQQTKECMGVSDVSLGNVKPENTSAILAVQKSTAVPLENIKDNLYDFVEQIVRVLIDMMATKYGQRPVVVTDENGNRQITMYDFSKLKDVDLHLGIDVGESTYYSQLAMLQTLDNLLAGQYIEFIDYLERIPNEMFPNKAEYIMKLKEQEQMATNGQYEQMAQYMEQLPVEEQQRLQQMPPEQMEMALKQMIGI